MTRPLDDLPDPLIGHCLELVRFLRATAGGQAHFGPAQAEALQALAELGLVVVRRRPSGRGEVVAWLTDTPEALY